MLPAVRRILHNCLTRNFVPFILPPTRLLRVGFQANTSPFDTRAAFYTITYHWLGHCIQSTRKFAASFIQQIRSMLAAFGFLRFSCSLFTHCFVKTKRARRRGSNRRQGSDSEDEDSIDLSRRAVSAAKSAIAQVAIRVRPRRSCSRPRLPSLWTCFLNRNRTTHETVVSSDAVGQQGGETEISDRDQDVRNRRCYNKRNSLSDVFRMIPWPQLDADRECVESLSSGDCSHYPSGSVSDGDSDSIGFGTGNSFSPLTSMESFVNKDGLNPTFFGIHSSDEEDTEMLQKQPPMRRISSFVDGDHQLKESAHDSRNQQLLINPAYRRDSAESLDDSDAGDTDCEAETKMKSFKSLVKTGCLALPTSTDLFDSQYIKHTSLNPTYGDHMLPSDISDAEDGDIDTETDDPEFSYLETPFSLPPSPLDPSELMKNETFGRGFLEQTSNRTSTWSPRSLPMLSLCELGGSGSRSENMGTLTWRNLIFSHAEESDDDDQHRTMTETNKSVADLQIRWRKTLYAEDMELDGLSDGGESCLHRSAVSDPTMRHLENSDEKPPSALRQGVGFKKLPQRKAKGINRRIAITPIRSISYEAFEEIDFKGHPVSETHPGKESVRNDQGAKFSKSKASSNRRSRNLLAAGLKHTRCAIRSLSLLVSRVEIFAAPKNKK